jgi:hypothetical protein
MSSQVMQHYDWCTVILRTEKLRDPAIRQDFTIENIVVRQVCS